MNQQFIALLEKQASKRAQYISQREKEEALQKDLAYRKRLKKIEDQFLANGANYPLTLFIKREMHDPDSYEHVSTTRVVMEDHFIVQTTFRGTNAFGAK